MKKVPKIKVGEFRRWLERLSKRSYFRNCNSDSCPIARYTRETVGGDEPWLPEWATRYINAIDSLPGVDARVSRDRALETLIEVAYRRA